MKTNKRSGDAGEQKKFLTQNEGLSEKKLRSSVKWKDYKNYINSGFGLIGTLFLLLCFIVTQLSAVTTDYWISKW